MARLLLCTVLLAGCNPCGRDTGPTLDTGWFEADSGGCSATVLRTWPVDGQEDWGWRSPPAARVAVPEDELYGLRVLDTAGQPVPSTTTWRGDTLQLDLEVPLTPDSPHTLEVVDCEGTRELSFRTSPFGLPLAVGPGALVERTYVFDMTSARWDEPQGFSAVIGLYFTTPVLVGVQFADAGHIDVLGAPGVRQDDGRFRQAVSESTWDFPVADFAESPYFEAHADQITLTIEGAEVPVHDFTLAGTFAADGASLLGGHVAGLGDTRNMGPVLNQGDDPGAACSVAAAAGAECEPCPDGQPYCLRLSARDVVGPLEPGLVLRRVE